MTLAPQYDHQIDRTLVSAEAIDRRVREIGAQLSGLYKDSNPIMVGVLTGAFVFMADLVRSMSIPLEVEFMAVSSYGLATETSGVVRILKDLERPIEDRDVVVVEDIVDSGLTLTYLVDVLKRRNPRSLRIVALFAKDKPAAKAVSADIIGFSIPDEFVVGYGLDAGGRFRNLPYLATIRSSAAKDAIP